MKIFVSMPAGFVRDTFMTEENVALLESLGEVTWSQSEKNLTAEQLDDLKANILQNDMIVKAMATDSYAETINQVLIPKVIRERYPSLSDDEVEITIVVPVFDLGWQLDNMWKK